MKRALVDAGAPGRVYQVEAPGDEVPVSEPLQWVDAPDDVTTAWTWDGAALQPPPGRDLEDERTAALEALPYHAEAARRRWITPGDGKAQEYREKQREAERYRQEELQGTPDPSGYPWLAAEVGVFGADLAEVVAAVEARISAWRDAGVAIRRAEINAREQLRNARSVGEIDEVLAGIAWPEPGG